MEIEFVGFCQIKHKEKISNFEKRDEDWKLNSVYASMRDIKNMPLKLYIYKS